VEHREGQESGADQVDRVVVTERLAEHVVYTGGFKDCTHAATSDYAGTGGRRLEQDGACAV
jgi:hypothetical protein